MTRKKREGLCILFILKLSDCIMLVRLETFLKKVKDETFKAEVRSYEVQKGSSMSW